MRYTLVSLSVLSLTALAGAGIGVGSWIAMSFEDKD
jgi:hypothetical protein